MSLPRPALPFLLAFVISLAGCSQRIAADTRDSTAPFATMSVLGFGDSFSVNSTTGPVNRELPSTSARVTILAAGKDADGGVQNIWIGFATYQICDAGGGVGRARTSHGDLDNPDHNNTRPGYQANVTRLVAHVFEVSTLRCENGGGSFEVDVRARATNFAGLEDTTPEFRFFWRAS